MLKEIDIKAGDLTFGQRIELGKILTSGEPEFDIFKQCVECLYGKRPRLTLLNVKENIRIFTNIVEGIKYWMDLEKELLKYEPTIQERRAGISDLTAKVGEYATIKALAKTYAQDPDTILTWKYGKVFGLLYTDLEEYKFQLKLHKQMEASNKK